MNDLPIIELHLRSMERSICQALMEHELVLSKEIQRAVKDYCSTDNLYRVLYRHVEETLNRVVKEEVERFYQYGEGRKAIAEAVMSRLTSEQ